MFVPLPLEFYLNYTVSNEIQGLSSTDRNFQGLSRCVRTLYVVMPMLTLQTEGHNTLLMSLCHFVPCVNQSLGIHPICMRQG